MMSLAQPWQVHCKDQSPLKAPHITQDLVSVVQTSLTTEEAGSPSALMLAVSTDGFMHG